MSTRPGEAARPRGERPGAVQSPGTRPQIALDHARTVTLAWYEYDQAITVGKQRHLEIVRNGWGGGNNGKHGLLAHIQGAAAEIAVAKLLGVYWPASVNTFKSVPDVGDRYEVRCISRESGDLPIYQRDPPDRVFILAVGGIPSDGLPYFRVVGGILGSEGKQPRFWRPRASTFFVPQRALLPLEGLI